jgi:hypothetical protein
LTHEVVFCFVSRAVGCNCELEKEAALADDEAEIVRLLEALNGVDSPEICGQSVNNDAANWVSRALCWGADMGLSADISALILAETLNKIRVASTIASNARERKRARARMVGARRRIPPTSGGASQQLK